MTALYKIFDPTDPDSEPDWPHGTPGITAIEFKGMVFLASAQGKWKPHEAPPELYLVSYAKCAWMTKDDARSLGHAVLAGLGVVAEPWPGREVHVAVAEWLTECNAAVITMSRREEGDSGRASQ